MGSWGSKADKKVLDDSGRNSKKEQKKRKSSGKVSTQTMEDVFELGEELGKGATSVVRLAVNKKTGQKVAVKCIDRLKLEDGEEAQIRHEVDIMKTLEHDNIVQFIDFFEEDDFFYVVLEFLEGGELFDRIVKKNFYNEKEARDLVKVILKGMKYIHDKGIAHRDMKPENLLMISKDDDSYVKLADFGFAIHGSQEGEVSVTNGTPGFLAPEVLNNEGFDMAVDMWSLGVITYILLGGYPPFQDDSDYRLFRKIRKGKYEFHDEYWSEVSAEAKDFIRCLLKVNPAERMTCDAALIHPWLQCDSKSLEENNLNHSLTALKKYQFNRKFRVAGNAIMALNRLNSNVSQRSFCSESTADREPIPCSDKRVLAQE